MTSFSTPRLFLIYEGTVVYQNDNILFSKDCEERERRRRQWEAELLEERLKLQKPAEIPVSINFSVKITFCIGNMSLSNLYFVQEPIGEYESTEEHENDNGIVEETNVFY